MADLSTKKDPLHLRDERPDYVEDTSGSGDVDGEDYSETEQPTVGTDPQTTGDLGTEKPTIHLDPEAVRQAEAEGKGFGASPE